VPQVRCPDYGAKLTSALDTACQLGIHLLDRGCSIVARSGLPLDGLDTAVVEAQDRAAATRGRGWHAAVIEGEPS
jgi:hypothetical protein